MVEASTIDAVGKLDDILRNPVKRRRFHEDPKGTMRDANANSGDVPAQVWWTLTHMSPDELAAIAELGVALDESGLFDAGVVWHHVV